MMLRKYPQSHILKTRKIQRNGKTRSAHMIVYSFTEEGTPWQNLQVWTIKDGMAYIIT
jgi:hypothetical protein